ncbi:MAG TPA: hypothetical protein PKD45_03785 [Flavobacteriales bacterium]|nr:hypothetical protein [Flavobacteriales bacterium]
MRYSLIVAIAGIVLLAGCWGSYEPTAPEELARGFEFELHQPITPEVQGLRIKRVHVGDGVGSWVKFEATPEMVARLVKDFFPSERKTFDTGKDGANVPKWWRPDEDGMAVFYYAEKWEKGCSTFSFAYLAHDAAKQIVYFHHSGS